jgi:hypothetical protein
MSSMIAQIMDIFYHHMIQKNYILTIPFQMLEAVGKDGAK